MLKILWNSVGIIIFMATAPLWFVPLWYCVIVDDGCKKSLSCRFIRFYCAIFLLRKKEGAM